MRDKSGVPGHPHREVAERTPLVSVIMRSHNDGRFLDQAVGSVLDQTYRHLELIIVNDASTDCTRERVEYWRTVDRRVRVIHNPRGRGGPASSNIGLQAAKGEYVANLDADNYWVDSGKLAEQVKWLEEHRDYVLVGGLTRTVDVDGRALSTSRRAETDTQIRRKILRSNGIGNSVACFRRSAAQQVGGYPEEFLGLSEDFGLWLALGQLGKFHNPQRVWNAYRVTGDNISDLKRADQIRDQLHYVRKHRRQYPGYLTAEISCFCRLTLLKLMASTGISNAARARIQAWKALVRGRRSRSLPA
jgi:glycosyltransferase involved in cell wall biosynthesis